MPSQKEPRQKVIIKPIYVDLETAAQIVSISESTLKSMVRSRDFPQPRKTSDRRVAWLLREVEEWAESRPVSDLPPPPNTGAKKPRASTTETPETPTGLKAA